MLSIVRFVHDSFYTSLEGLLSRRPSVGYVFAAASGGAGTFMSFIEGSTKLISFAAALIGLAVACYTLRIQHSLWKERETKDALLKETLRKLRATSASDAEQ